MKKIFPSFLINRNFPDKELTFICIFRDNFSWLREKGYLLCWSIEALIWCCWRVSFIKYIRTFTNVTIIRLGLYFFCWAICAERWWLGMLTIYKCNRVLWCWKLNFFLTLIFCKRIRPFLFSYRKSFFNRWDWIINHRWSFKLFVWGTSR